MSAAEATALEACMPGSTVIGPALELKTVVSTEPRTQSTTMRPTPSGPTRYSTVKTVPRIRTRPAGVLTVKVESAFSLRTSPMILPRGTSSSVTEGLGSFSIWR